MRIGYRDVSQVLLKVKDLNMNGMFLVPDEEDNYIYDGEDILHFKNVKEVQEFAKAMVFFSKECERKLEEEEDNYPDIIGPGDLPEDNTPKRISIRILKDPITTTTAISVNLIQVVLSNLRDNIIVSVGGTFADYVDDNDTPFNYQVIKTLEAGTYDFVVTCKDEEGNTIAEKSIEINVVEA